MVTELRFAVPINPWSLGINSKDRLARGRRGGKAHRYVTEAHTSAARVVELAARAAIRSSGVSYPRGPVVLELSFAGERRSTKYGPCGCAADLDGPIKAVQDAITKAGVWSDDVQVCRIVATKTHGPPSIGVVVRAMEVA